MREAELSQLLEERMKKEFRPSKEARKKLKGFHARQMANLKHREPIKVDIIVRDLLYILENDKYSNGLRLIK